MIVVIGVILIFLVMFLASRLTSLSRDVMKCPNCGDWAVFEETLDNGDLLFICPKCRKKIIMKGHD